MDDMVTNCPRCNDRVYRRLDRTWSGDFVEVTEDGTEEFPWVCDNCHRELVRG